MLDLDFRVMNICFTKTKKSIMIIDIYLQRNFKFVTKQTYNDRIQHFRKTKSTS
jgi:hypothetical protein